MLKEQTVSYTEHVVQRGPYHLSAREYPLTRVGFWLKQPGKSDEEERSDKYPCQKA